MLDRKSSPITEMMLKLPWPEILADAWKYARKILRGLKHEGTIHVEQYESTLELQNKKGTRARFNKIKHIRYLQDNNIAFQDYAWGNGNILLNYQCSPGKKVDQYSLGYKKHILISLGMNRNRGEEDEFRIQWDIKDGFLKSDGYWDTVILHRTKSVKINVIFPKSRPPKRAVLIESNHRRRHLLGKDHFNTLSDGRIGISWEKKNPRLFEHYLLWWEW